MYEKNPEISHKMEVFSGNPLSCDLPDSLWQVFKAHSSIIKAKLQKSTKFLIHEIHEFMKFIKLHSERWTSFTKFGRKSAFLSFLLLGKCLTLAKRAHLWDNCPGKTFFGDK